MKIEKVCLSKENLLKVEKIDDAFYKDAITGIGWYLERFNENHSAYFLIDDYSNVVGYIISVPIRQNLYEAIINGTMLNDLYINPNMFINNSNYHYIYSCVIDEEYRHNGYGIKLIETLLKDLHGNICCLTISKGGYNLVSKFMDLKEKLNDNVSVFVKSIK